jgi:ribonuclease P protein component
MIPPKASETGREGDPELAAAVLFCEPPANTVMETLRRRPDFLRAASAKRIVAGSFLLQARHRNDETDTIRIGYTASKKIGNAVARNRAKRRMRAAVSQVLPQLGIAGWDYVLVAKPGATIARDFQDLLRDLSRALGQIHAGPKAAP